MLRRPAEAHGRLVSGAHDRRVVSLNVPALSEGRKHAQRAFPSAHVAVSIVGADRELGDAAVALGPTAHEEPAIQQSACGCPSRPDLFRTACPGSMESVSECS